MLIENYRIDGDTVILQLKFLVAVQVHNRLQSRGVASSILPLKAETHDCELAIPNISVPQVESLLVDFTPAE